VIFFILDLLNNKNFLIYEFLLKVCPIIGILQALSKIKGKKDLNRLKIPYVYKKNPTKNNFNINIIKKPPKKKELPFNLPLIYIFCLF